MVLFLKKSRRALAFSLALCLFFAPARAFAHSIVWLTDTQHYYGSRAEIFHSMCDWILASRESLDIRFVFHSGDIVSASRSETQWESAASAMGKLHGKIPYLAAAGNHDLGSKYNFDNYYAHIDGAQDPQLSGDVYKDGQCRYTLFSAEGRDYIFLSIGFTRSGPDEEMAAWINEVLRAHAQRSAILLTHSYLHADGKRLTTQGTGIYRNIVEPNSNVWLVLSGHCRRPSRTVHEIDDDGDGEAERKVYAVMANYQDAPQGGSGYLRILHFAEELVHFNTYSPYLDDNNFFTNPGQDSFSIPLP